MSTRKFPPDARSIAVLLVALAAPASSAVAPEATGQDEHVRVIGTRIADDLEAADEDAAHVTILDREWIRRSGATTLQELLASVSGVVIYDQVGNDLEKTLDLRGFNRGSGIKIYLDGAPLNATRNNTPSLQLVPLSALERIEIHRGSSAAPAGGGSEAGVIHLLTRSVETLEGSLSLAAGSDAAQRFAGEIFARAGRVDLSFVGSRDESDGFRANAGGELDRLSGTAGIDVGRNGRLELNWLGASSALGNPGALTREDYAAGIRDAGYNAEDFARRDLDQAALNFRTTAAHNLSLAANLFLRRQTDEILSTGRAAPVFGGFFLDSAERASGATLQLSHESRRDNLHNRLIVGAEYLEGTTDATGIFTSPADPAAVDRSSPGSLNRTRRATGALFAQDQWSPNGAWQLHAGIRFDLDRTDYRDRLESTIDDSKRFSEISIRAGAAWTPWSERTFRVSYGETFLPPTAEDLFAFPLFGSNPRLRPQDSHSLEAGFHARLARRWMLDAALFRIDTVDEIIFVPGAPPDFIGRNDNAGETRRQGLEVELRTNPTPRVELFAALTLIDAELRSGEATGRDLPLVPRQRLAAGLDVELGAGVELRLHGLYVGEQVLDNDPSNARAALAAYTVVDARTVWAPRRRGSTGDGAWSLFLEATNLLDRTYATRGIYAFDFVTFENRDFLTPAPGRRLRAGATWSF